MHPVSKVESFAHEIRTAYSRANTFLDLNHLRLLRNSAISPEVSQARGYQTITTRSALRRYGFGVKTGLEFSVCRSPGVGVSPNHDSIWKFRLKGSQSKVRRTARSEADRKRQTILRRFRMRRQTYYFGTLVKQIDIFSYPRTGAHFFTYCFMGLFDLISFPHEDLHNREAIERQLELSERSLYGLDLRESSVPYQPIWLNALANGMHGMPKKGQSPAMLLIRDPIATAYSYYRVRHRWGFEIERPIQWLNNYLAGYYDFYEQGFTMLRQFPADTLLISYESLVESPKMLEEVVRLVGVKPKLAPGFVYWLTQFSNFTVPGERSFYREGRNDAWQEDVIWVNLLRGADPRDFKAFGYGSISTCIDRVAKNGRACE